MSSQQSMTQVCHFLFVYGTLLPGDRGTTGRAQRARLARESKVLGSACTAGRLFNLGRYPGLVPSVGTDDVVHGELLELSDAERTLRWLDAYEGIVPGQHPHNEYERVLRPVALGEGTTVTAWVYEYRMEAQATAWIPTGRWLGEG